MAKKQMVGEGLFEDELGKTEKSTTMVESFATSKKIAAQIQAAENRIEWPDNYFIANNEKMVRRLVADITEAGEFIFDCETQGLNPWIHKLYCIGFWIKDHGYVIPLEHTLMPSLAKEIAQKYLKAVFADPDIKRSNASIKFDAHFVREQLGLKVGKFYADTLVQSQVINPDNTTPHGLKELCALYGLAPNDGNYKAQFGKTAWSYLPAKLASYYAIHDTELVYKLHRKQNQILEGMTDHKDGSLKLKKLFWDVEMPMVNLTYRMEMEGIRVDQKYFDETLKPTVYREWSAALEELAPYVKPYLSYVDATSVQQVVDSPTKLVKVFFDKLDVPQVNWVTLKKGKTGQFDKLSLDKEAINGLSKTVEPIRLLGQYRKWATVKKMFVDALPDKFVNGKVHPIMNVIGTETGRMSLSNPNCYDGETEILTTDGWRLFKDLSYLSEVAQYTTSGHIEFVKPSSILCQTYSGKMLTFDSSTDSRNGFVNLRVTEDHRMVYRSKKSQNLQIKPASETNLSWTETLHAGKYLGGDKELVPQIITFLCAVQADGTFTKDGAMVLQFKKDRKISRFRKCLVDLGIEYYETDRQHGGTRFRIPSRYRNLLHPWIDEDKCWTWEVLSLNQASLSLLYAEHFLWDGLASGSQYTSKHEVNCDVLQAVGVLTGCRVNRRTSVVGGVTYFRNDSTDREYTSNQSLTSTEQQVRGELVYCVTVPSGMVVVRRNGRPIISGNCQQIPSRQGPLVRNLFVPGPGNVFFSCDFSGQEIRVLSHYSRDPKLMDFYLHPKGLDIYSQTALDVFGDSDFHKSGTTKAEFAKMSKSDRKNIGVYRDAKALVLGLGYKMGHAKYARNTGKSSKEGKRDFDLYYSTYVRVKKYQDATIEFARKHGYGTTLLGRRRPFPYINSTTENGLRAAAERAATNLCIQGSSADMVKLAAINVSRLIAKNKWPIRIVLIIHDEILYETPIRWIHEHPEVVKQITETMCSALPLIVPMESSATFEERWGSEREFDELDELLEDFEE